MNTNHFKSLKAKRRNKDKFNKTRTLIKKVRNYIILKDKSSALFLYKTMVSNLDRLAKCNIIHKNKCNRLKRRINFQVRCI